MLREVIATTDVRRTLESAPLPPVPWFSQLRAAAGVVATSPLERGHEVEMDESAVVESREPDEKQRTLARHAAVQGSMELQELAEYVLEGTLFNLVSEASHGEFSLFAKTRQIVASSALHVEQAPAEAPP